MKKNNLDNLTFDKFRELAVSNHLSRHEKVGFPDEYRDGKEQLIFADILSKVGALNGHGKTILEIGPGCSHLPIMLATLCKNKSHKLHFIDSAEMLSALPDDGGVQKWPGRYPDGVDEFLNKFNGSVDGIIVYSVIQYVFIEGNLYDFFDKTLALLAPGGDVLFGDLPNITMRKRFFSSEVGIKSHHKYIGRDELPPVRFNELEGGRMDDSIILGLLARARAQGFHAWVVPQAVDLPMANRREDILIRRP